MPKVHGSHFCWLLFCASIRYGDPLHQEAAEESSRYLAITQQQRHLHLLEARSSKKRVIVRRAAAFDNSKPDEEVTSMLSQSPTMPTMDEIYMQMDRVEPTPMPNETMPNETIPTTPMPKGIVVSNSDHTTATSKTHEQTHNESNSWQSEQYNASNSTRVDNWHSRQKVGGQDIYGDAGLAY
mmetsp:Transcript_49483/g.87111  ORF Transcript_49483/g.87111 Transcript_49483/m.87111 type:complete len:182 (+) Transcript_49483:60-605(+)